MKCSDKLRDELIRQLSKIRNSMDCENGFKLVKLQREEHKIVKKLEKINKNHK